MKVPISPAIAKFARDPSGLPQVEKGRYNADVHTRGHRGYRNLAAVRAFLSESADVTGHDLSL